MNEIAGGASRAEHAVVRAGWSRRRVRWLAVGAAVLLPVAVRAQLVGKLSDPQRAVFAAFPEATGYRTIVREVDRDARAAIEARLRFAVHIAELGPHGLYVAMRRERPVGLLYMQSEESEWGIAEIVWAIRLDLRIAGFQLQRSRSRHMRALVESPFGRALRGLALDQLDTWIDEQGRLTARAGAVDTIARRQAAIIVRSGVKALAVISVVWREEIEKLQDLDMGFAAFPRAYTLRRIVVDRPAGSDDNPASGIEHLRAVQVRDPRGRVLGFAARTESRHQRRTLTLHWTLAPDGRVLAVKPAAAWPGVEIRTACRTVEGAHPRDLPGGGGPVHAAALELIGVLLVPPGVSGR